MLLAALAAAAAVEAAVAVGGEGRQRRPEAGGECRMGSGPPCPWGGQ